MRPELLHHFDPQSREKAFPCPRTWEMISGIVHRRNGLDAAIERALFRGTVGEAAAVEFSAFLKVWRELPHPRTVIDDPENAVVPDNASALIALCGSLYRMADDINLGSIVTYAMRLRRRGRRVPRRLVHPPPARPAAHRRLHPLGRRQDPVTPQFGDNTMNLTLVAHTHDDGRSSRAGDRASLTPPIRPPIAPSLRRPGSPIPARQRGRLRRVHAPGAPAASADPVRPPALPHHYCRPTLGRGFGAVPGARKPGSSVL